MAAVFTGVVKSVGELVAAAQSEPEPDWRALYGHVGVVHDAADFARWCRQMLEQGEGVKDCWRFGILQTIDAYQGCLRRGGRELAAKVFTREPPPTTSTKIDAAFAALAAHLADEDRWSAPAWVDDSRRVTGEPWFVAEVPAFVASALEESPPHFRRRGIFIGARDLLRA